MTAKIVKTIIDDLNNFLNVKFSTSDSYVIVSNLINQSGELPQDNLDKIVCSLVNLKQEQNQVRSGFTTNRLDQQSSPRSFSLFFMFSSCYIEKNYLEGIEILSVVANYFQEKTIFTPQNTPALPPNTSKVSFEMVNPGLEHLSHLWQALGAKYMPSVIFQVRIVSFQDDSIRREIPVVKGVSQE